MRTAQQIMPGKPEASYTEYTPGWLSIAMKKNNQVLRDVRDVVHSDSLNIVMQYTMGKGPAGLEREAYYAGWVVVGYWLKNGMTLAQIARIKENDMPSKVTIAIDKLLGQT